MTNKRIDDDVLAVLQNASCEDTHLTIKEQLARPLYVKTNKVLEALGGKWNSSKRAHVFDEPAAPLIADTVAVGAYVDAKKLFQAFNTPQHLAELLCDYLPIVPGCAALEPSAGTGVIARELRSRGASVECVEIQEKLASDLYNDSGFVTYCANFLEWGLGRRFDVVGMNPPFTRGQDMDHVQKAYECLKPVGTLAAFMSPGWRFRQDRKAVEFRRWVDDLSHEVQPIDPGEFKESGTMIRTVLVVIHKEE